MHFLAFILASTTVPDWASITLALSAVIGSLYATIQKVVRPMLRAGLTVEKALPVLLDVAKEFSTNGGSTLRDTINRVEADVAKVKGDIADVKTLAADLADLRDVITGKMILPVTPTSLVPEAAERAVGFIPGPPPYITSVTVMPGTAASSSPPSAPPAPPAPPASEVQPSAAP